MLQNDTIVFSSSKAAANVNVEDDCSADDSPPVYLTEPSKYQLVHLLALHDLLTMQLVKDCLVKLIAGTGDNVAGEKINPSGLVGLPGVLVAEVGCGGYGVSCNVSENKTCGCRLKNQLLWVDLLTLALTKSLSHPIITEQDIEIVDKAIGASPTGTSDV